MESVVVTTRVSQEIYDWLTDETEEHGNCSIAARVRYHLQQSMDRSKANSEAVSFSEESVNEVAPA